MAGEYPFQFTALLPSEDMQVTVLLLVTSTKYKWSRWAWKGFISPGVKGEKSERNEAIGQTLGVGEREGRRADCVFLSAHPPPVLQSRQQGSGTVGKWTPCWWPKTSPRGLWSPSITLQTRRPLPQHFQQSTSDYLFMTLQHGFSSNFMAFH